VPVEKYGHLEPLLLPSEIEIHLRRGHNAINAAVSTILDCLPMDDTGEEIVVGYDCEWNCVVSDNGQVEKGEIAVIQIAHEKRVYILQVRTFVFLSSDIQLILWKVSDVVAARRLPDKLAAFLHNPRIRKVGRAVNADLKQLEATVRSPRPFAGALDIAAYAKERCVISNARCGLADLCAAVLGKRLNKNVSERTSAAWEQDTLTAQQQQYAALDAFVPLLLHQKLSSLSVPQRLSEDLVPSTPVLLYHTDNTTVIACGRLSSTPITSIFDDIKISKRHALVEITGVRVPGAKISSHRKRTLASFGALPFLVVCIRSHLRTYSDTTSFNHIPLASSDPAAPTLAMPDVVPMDVDVPHMVPDGDLNADDREEPDADNEGLAGGVGDMIRDMLKGNTNMLASAHSATAAADPHSQAIGENTLSNIPSPDLWPMAIRSRVLKDPFHVFNMLNLSTTHGLRKEFGRALRDVLFIPDCEDRMRISAWGNTLEPPKSFEQLVLSNPRWLHRHCRRVIPPPEILFPHVQRLFLAFGPLRDATTQQPLFNERSWAAAKQILELIRQGFLSDPPGVPLYTVIGTDLKAAHLPIYRCSRGTNFTEGGVHTQLLARLPTSGTSVRHLNACFSDFVLVHNLRVSLLLILHKTDIYKTQRLAYITVLVENIEGITRFGSLMTFKSDSSTLKTCLRIRFFLTDGPTEISMHQQPRRLASSLCLSHSDMITIWANLMTSLLTESKSTDTLHKCKVHEKQSCRFIHKMKKIFFVL